MGRRFILWAIACLLSAWLSITLPAVAFAAPESESGTSGASGSDSASSTPGSEADASADTGSPTPSHDKGKKEVTPKRAVAEGDSQEAAGSAAAEHAAEQAAEQAAEAAAAKVRKSAVEKPRSANEDGIDAEAAAEAARTEAVTPAPAPSAAASPTGPLLDAAGIAEPVAQQAAAEAAASTEVAEGSLRPNMESPEVSDGNAALPVPASPLQLATVGKVASPVSAEGEGVEGALESNVESLPTSDGTASSPALADGAPEAVRPEVAAESTFVALVMPDPATDVEPPNLLNVIGTLFFTAFDMVVRIFEGPPAVPAGSTVTVGRSKLEIDGYTADADWYFPDTDEPAGLIYFQHGIMGRAGFYNAMAADLAERTNSIVVSPSITSNFFASDGRQLVGLPMAFGIAKLFDGDRAALTASASSAAGHQVELPWNYILAGQSAGGHTAGAAAGYAVQSAQNNGTPLELAGVLLLDTNAITNRTERILAAIPADVPIFHIAAEPVAINNFGNLDAVLEELRPGQFNGVRLVGGAHGDGFRSVNPVINSVVSLIAGTPRAENVEAVLVLSQGWVADMFAGTVFDEDARTGSYPGADDSMLSIPTDEGIASGYVLPGPVHELSLIDRFVMFFLSALGA